MTPEQEQLRRGRLTASCAAVICGGLDTSGLALLVKKLAWQRVYGDTGEESFRSAWMDRGTALEAEAMDWYEFTTDREVIRQPFVPHPTLDYVSCIPDGLAEDRVVEGKAPLHTTWAETKRTRTVPSEYRHQVRWQMWCTGKRLCDFVCYHPIPKGIIVPFELTDVDVAFLEERCALVNEKVEKWVSILKEAA